MKTSLFQRANNSSVFKDGQWKNPNYFDEEVAQVVNLTNLFFNLYFCSSSQTRQKDEKKNLSYVKNPFYFKKLESYGRTGTNAERAHKFSIISRGREQRNDEKRSVQEVQPSKRHRNAQQQNVNTDPKRAKVFHLKFPPSPQP